MDTYYFDLHNGDRVTIDDIVILRTQVRRGSSRLNFLVRRSWTEP